jgi:hypothetical protein
MEGEASRQASSRDLAVQKEATPITGRHRQPNRIHWPEELSPNHGRLPRINSLFYRLR